MKKLNYKIFNFGLIQTLISLSIGVLFAILAIHASEVEQVAYLILVVISSILMSIGIFEMIKRREKINNLKEIIPSTLVIDDFLEMLDNLIALNDSDSYDELFLKKKSNSQYQIMGLNVSQALYQLGFRSELLFGIWYEVPFEAFEFRDVLISQIKEYKKPFKRRQLRIFNEIV